MKIKVILASTFLLLVFVLIAYYFLRNMEKFESSPTITFYYLEKCPWCVKFKPIWENFEQKVKETNLQVITRSVDGANPVNEKEISKNNITGFPHVQLESDKGPVVFKEDRTVDNLISFVKKNT
jgi:glutaredoxin